MSPETKTSVGIDMNIPLGYQALPLIEGFRIEGIRLSGLADPNRVHGLDRFAGGTEEVPELMKHATNSDVQAELQFSIGKRARLNIQGFWGEHVPTGDAGTRSRVSNDDLGKTQHGASITLEIPLGGK